MSKSDRQQANETYKAAKAELERVSRRDKTETDAYLKANDEVAKTAKNVSWWRR